MTSIDTIRTSAGETADQKLFDAIRKAIGTRLDSLEWDLAETALDVVLDDQAAIHKLNQMGISHDDLVSHRWLEIHEREKQFHCTAE